MLPSINEGRFIIEYDDNRLISDNLFSNLLTIFKYTSEYKLATNITKYHLPIDIIDILLLLLVYYTEKWPAKEYVNVIKQSDLEMGNVIY